MKSLRVYDKLSEGNKNKIASMKTILYKLQKENLINEDIGFTLFELFGKNIPVYYW